MSDSESEKRKLTPSFIASSDDVGFSDDLRSSSDEVFDHYCDACAEDGKHLEAKGFCVDCVDYLCGQCVQSHGKSRASRNHVVQDKSQMPSQKPPTPVVAPSKHSSNEQCENHPGRFAEYYCRDDGSLGCTICMTVKHRQCQGVDLISDISKQLLDSQDYRQFTTSLTTLKSQFKDIIKNSRENTTQADKLCTDIANALQALRGQVIQAFDKMETDVKKTIGIIKSVDIDKMKDIWDTGTDVLHEVDKICTDVQTLENENQLGQLFVKMIKLEDRIQALHKLLHQTDANNSVTAYKFEPSTAIYQIIDDPTSIGTLSIYSTVNKEQTDQQKYAPQRTSSASRKPPPRPTAPNLKSRVPPTDAKLDDLKAIQVNNITVRTKTDEKGCRITGSVKLSDDKVVLVDEGNFKIKLLNLQTSKITSEIQYPSMPWDVAKISEGQAVATLRYAKKIVFVKVASELNMDREMTVGGKCTAILHNNGKLIVAFGEAQKIEIMTLDGTVERSIECSNMLKGPWQMAIGPEYDAIYVSDKRSACIKKLGLGGVVEAEYKDTQLMCQSDIIVGPHGRIFVCEETSSGSINVLTPGLTKIKVLVDGLSRPSSLCLCHNKNRLYVCSKSDSMAVFQLS